LINAFFKKYRQYLSNLSVSFLSQACTALSILMITPILLNALGKEAFSSYGIILNVITFSAVLDFGLSIGLLRRIIHEPLQARQAINGILIFYGGLFILAMPAYYWVYRSGMVMLNQSVLPVAVLTAAIVIQNILALFFDAIIQSTNKIYLGRSIKIIKTVLEFLALWYASRYGSISILLLATTLINIVYLLCMYLVAKKTFHFSISLRSFRFSVMLDNIRYSFWYFQHTLATVLVYNAQIILLGNIIDKVSVTKYLLVIRFYEVVRLGLANFTIIMFPSLLRLEADRNWSHLKQLFIKLTTRIAFMVLLVFGIMVTAGKIVFFRWSHFDDQEIGRLFILYSVFIALLLIEHVPTVFLSALKYNRAPAIVGTLQGLMSLLFTWLLVPSWGIAGAVMGSLAAFLLTNCFYNPAYLLAKINGHLRERQVHE
jgi:O-antigen/teichoic acid export membrane protein